MLSLFCTALWTPTKRETPDTFAARPTCTWRLERHEASYACVLLVKEINTTKDAMYQRAGYPLMSRSPVALGLDQSGLEMLWSLRL